MQRFHLCASMKLCLLACQTPGSNLNPCFVGYSAILMAGAVPQGARITSYEKDLTWVLVAKRFVWQASQGKKRAGTKDKVRMQLVTSCESC